MSTPNSRGEHAVLPADASIEDMLGALERAFSPNVSETVRQALIEAMQVVLAGDEDD